MTLVILNASERVPADSPGPALCIPVYGAHSRFIECVRSVLAHTPIGVPVLVADDASPDERSRAFLEQLASADVLRHAVYYYRSSTNRGFVRTINDAFERTAPADVVVVNSDCIVTPGWFEAITAAAAADTLVATVSVFTNNGTILSLPHRNRPEPTLPQTMSLDDAARAVQSQSLRVRPRIPTVVGHCFLIKRAALDLVGPFDLTFSPGYGEEVDFAQRCILHGLQHVVADDAFVFHAGSASFAPTETPSPFKRAHDDIIGTRYPYYYDWIRDFSDEAASPFARSIGAAARSLRGLTLTIDGRILTPIMTGTQLHTLETIAALSRHGGLCLRVVVPNDLGDYAHAVLRTLPHVKVLQAREITEGTEQSDVVHRPYQVSSRGDLRLLARLGERVVITQQDLIAFHNPGYFGSYESWTDSRRLTRRALALADQVVFFSHAAAEDAVTEELVSRDRACVVYIGTDHTLGGLPVEAKAPSSVQKLAGRPFLLCLGTDFAHKNRVFALRVLHTLREHHGWDGGLVFAGPHVRIGSSASEEASFLALRPELADVVVDTAAVGEDVKRWLLRNASLAIYPSVHEGFGLVPFEAADFDLACAFAAQTSVAELLPRSLALIEQWDHGATAARIAPLLESDELRAQHVAAVRAAAAPLTWRQTARRLVGVYTAATGCTAREARTLVDESFAEGRQLDATRVKLDAVRRKLAATRSELERSRRELREVDVRYSKLRDRFDATADGLVGPEGVIPPDLRRPLLAVGMRPMLRRPTFGLLRFVYRAGYRARHGGRAPASE